MAEKNKYTELFKPITIGKVEIKNRVVMCPVCNNYTEGDGFIGEQMLSYFAARAKGGVGLIFTTPAKMNLPTPYPGPYQNPKLWDKTHVKGWSELSETIHAFGAKAFVQVSSGGAGQVGPSPVRVVNEEPPEKGTKEFIKRGMVPSHILLEQGSFSGIPRVITLEEITLLEDQRAHTAAMAKEAGFDGVELHNSHGSLAYDFLSPRANLRNDMYGGNLENRTRHLRNALLKTRAKVGNDFPVGIRISAAEHVHAGLTVDDTAEICRMAESWSADFIDLSDGRYYSKYMLPDEDGTILPEAAIIRKAVKIPVITASVHDPAMADEAIKQGATDMIGLGRQLLADPEWVNKVARGEKFVKCTRCLVGCWGRLELGLPIRCELNPDLGRERYNPEYNRGSAPKKHFWHVQSFNHTTHTP